MASGNLEQPIVGGGIDQQTVSLQNTRPQDMEQPSGGDVERQSESSETSTSKRTCCCTEEMQRSTLCSVVFCLTACCVVMLAAMSLGFSSSALDTMGGHVKVDGVARDVPNYLVVFSSQNEGSWFASLVNIGALVGALSGGWLCSVVGQRNVMRLVALLIGLSWGYIATSKSVPLLLTARVVIGVGVGAQSVAVPSYIAEISPPHLRGVLGTTNAGSILVGVILVDLIGGTFTRAGDDNEFCDWRALSVVICIFSVVVLVASIALPAPRDEIPLSPQTPADASNPLAGMAMARTSSGPLSNAQYAKLALTGLVPMVWQQLSGINAVIFFGQSILASAGIKAFNVLGTSVICVQLLGIAVAAAVIERAGRRTLLVVSAGGMSVSAAFLAFLLNLSSPNAVAVVAALYGYVLLFSVGLGPVPWLLLPELGLPKNMRMQLAGVATAANWGCSFAVTGPPLSSLQDAYGLSGAFWVFSAVCLLGAVLIFLLVPQERKRRRRVGLERRFTRY